jgi:antitoxin CcdA
MMTHTYNLLAPKKPTNLSINSDLLSKAKGLKLNLSATLENALANEVRKAERTQWLNKNKAAIEASNCFADEKGLFSDSYRTI